MNWAGPRLVPFRRARESKAARMSRHWVNVRLLSSNTGYDPTALTLPQQRDQAILTVRAIVESFPSQGPSLAKLGSSELGVVWGV